MANRPASPTINGAPPSSKLEIDRLRNQKWQRKNPGFPLNTDRRAESNVPFTDPGLHRTWGGKAPLVTDGNQGLTTRAPKSMDSAQHQWTNPTQIFNVPEGYIGEPGGIVAVTGTVMVPDDQQGYPTDDPCNITDSWDNSNTDGCTAFYQRFPKPEGQFDGLNYIPSTSGALVRIVWENVGYISPIEPEVRFPTQGFKKRNNKYS